MKFTCSIDINAPIEKVVKLWEDPANLKYWQDGFVSIETVSGTPGAAGAKSKITFQNGKRKIELTETIQVNNLPAEKSALYEHPHMDNTMSNRFTDLGGGKTRFSVEGEYIRLSFIPKIMSKISPGVFTKPAQKWLDNFNRFVEKQP